MIVKRIGNPKVASSKASRIGSLIDYISADSHLEAEKTELFDVCGGFLSNSAQGQRAEMIALAEMAVRSKDPVDHWLLSWKEGEQPTHAQCKDAIDILKKHLGMNDNHLAVYALHRNTENYHLHVVLNRVDSETMRVEDKGWCIDRAHKAVAEIVYKQGWEAEKNARYAADRGGVAAQAGAASQTQPRSKARDYENATGEKSTERIAMEVAAQLLRNARSWAQVHEALAQVDMRYELKGSGALIWVGGQPLKASCMGREFSRSRMEERLGEFLPDTRSRSTPERREAEPLRSNMPAGWAEYSAALENSRREKDAAQLRQRGEHHAARDTQTSEFRKERADLYRGGKWSGDALNVARSLLAADHSRRRAELSDRQKRERNKLRVKLGKRKTFEQSLAEQGTPQLAEQWRYRDADQPEAALHGEGEEIPRKRDIRDFQAQIQPRSRSQAMEIHYSSNANPSRVCFTDRGKRIDVWQTQDEAAVLAALQLSAQKWGAVTVTGPDEFKLLCAQLAAQHGIRIANPELRPVSIHSPSERQPLPATPPAQPTPDAAYQMHKADILSRIEVRNPSQLDWMIAVRMRVTGHDREAVTLALQENAGQGREAESRNWANYAERTAQAVFGPRGDRECTRNEQRAGAWARVEGRDLACERQVRHRLRPKEPKRGRTDFGIG